MTALGVTHGVYGLGIALNLFSRLPTIVSGAEFRGVIADAARAMGFNCFAVIDHVDQGSLRAGEVGIYAYPDAVAERLRVYPRFRRDCVIRGVRRSSRAFAWSHMADFLTLSDADKRDIDFGRSAGLDDGVTVPVGGGQCQLGSLTFAGTRDGGDVQRYLGALQMIAPWVLLCARRVVGTISAPAPLPRLSPRQLDCTILAGQGLENKEIARKLGLSPDHVSDQIKAALARYGVGNRTALAYAALAAGEFDLSELAPQSPSSRGK